MYSSNLYFITSLHSLLKIVNSFLSQPSEIIDEGSLVMKGKGATPLFTIYLSFRHSKYYSLLLKNAKYETEQIGE